MSKLRLRLGILLAAFISILAVFAGYNYRRAAIANDVGHEVRQISLAMHNHNSAFGRLPSPNYYDASLSTEPLGSWRVEVSNFLELYGFPPINRHVIWSHEDNHDYHTMPIAYSYSSKERRPNNDTRIFAIIGSGTAFGDGMNDLPKSLDEIPGDMVVAVEVRESNTHWMAPGDYHLDSIERSILTEDNKFKSGAIQGRFHVIFADGEVWALRTDTPFENFSPLLTTTKLKNGDREELLAEYCLCRYK